ncbi:hypothetical protein Nepgr_002136 [Nepenthes gracilis]|uniref:Uncharacterized protein n=1 Tax=Nepenthes gracilis TaxID=150966 RepID=A0AAD3P6J5_NEPGR|nr:hypothetical protein Nepgr_002136 [Nepenthes gracilis]
MESSSSTSTESSPTWDYLYLFLFRPVLALSFVFSILIIGWWLAWKLVLVHVPLVQEIFGLRKKPVKPIPPTHHRLSRFYNSLNARDQAAASSSSSRC